MVFVLVIAVIGSIVMASVFFTSRLSLRKSGIRREKVGALNIAEAGKDQVGQPVAVRVRIGQRRAGARPRDTGQDQVDRVGLQLGDQDCVTLCYQRPRRLPDWPYNLFTMVHGKSERECEATLDAIAEATGCELKRVREGGSMRQGFHRIGSGGLIVELVDSAVLPFFEQWWAAAA